MTPESRLVRVHDKNLPLRNKEFDLFQYFLEHVGVVLTRTRLLEDVWDRNIFCSTNTVDVHVSTLRRKLKALKCGNLIKTVHCVGYVMTP